MRHLTRTDVVLASLVFIALACAERQPTSRPATTATTRTASNEGPSPQRGRYVILTAGCNDCHTPGFNKVGMMVPESLWLIGAPVGWRGPWGTTYSSNLRLFVKDMDEPTFVSVTRARNDRPPMPWTSLHAMTDEDLRSVYRYLKQLGPAGTPTPAYVPPGTEPTTPWLDMSVHLPKVPG